MLKQIFAHHLRFLIYGIILLLIVSCAKEELPQSPIPILHPNYHTQKLGLSAKDILTDEKFSSLQVEIQYMKGFRPEPETISILNDFLEAHLRKPNGIQINLSEIDSSTKKILSSQDVVAIEKEHRQIYPLNKMLSVYILITDGTHYEPNTLGMAYRNTSAVMFGASLQKHFNYQSVLTKSELETTVLLHELGHLMGLGNIVDSKNKKLTDKQRHCPNELCLMYYATETNNLSIINRKGKIPLLDVACRIQLNEISGLSMEDYYEGQSFFLN